MLSLARKSKSRSATPNYQSTSRKGSQLPTSLRTIVNRLFEADLEPTTAFFTWPNLPLEANESLHKIKEDAVYSPMTS